MLLVRQQDKPGIIAAVSNILGRESVNISFMTVRRLRPTARCTACRCT